jgi:hypothetical protein
VASGIRAEIPRVFSLAISGQFSLAIYGKVCPAVPQTQSNDDRRFDFS